MHASKFQQVLILWHLFRSSFFYSRCSLGKLEIFTNVWHFCCFLVPSSSNLIIIQLNYFCFSNTVFFHCVIVLTGSDEWHLFLPLYHLFSLYFGGRCEQEIVLLLLSQWLDPSSRQFVLGRVDQSRLKQSFDKWHSKYKAKKPSK